MLSQSLCNRFGALPTLHCFSGGRRPALANFWICPRYRSVIKLCFIDDFIFAIRLCSVIGLLPSIDCSALFDLNLLHNYFCMKHEYSLRRNIQFRVYLTFFLISHKE